MIELESVAYSVTNTYAIVDEVLVLVSTVSKVSTLVLKVSSLLCWTNGTFYSRLFVIIYIMSNLIDKSVWYRLLTWCILQLVILVNKKSVSELQKLTTVKMSFSHSVLQKKVVLFNKCQLYVLLY